ncbi:hypothetical protein ACRALDRAFT_2036648 [Sodiomyces alcalophilus JCM 7366]|uniref:uncharacterized protein n=1 Tax=Sodiomyces alcalophilus JCM 7366 TaxID=591952 RepID=UPI0039B423BD
MLFAAWFANCLEILSRLLYCCLVCREHSQKTPELKAGGVVTKRSSRSSTSARHMLINDPKTPNTSRAGL